MLANLAQVQQKSEKGGQCHIRGALLFSQIAGWATTMPATIPYYVKM